MISRAQSLLAVIAGVAMLALAGGAYAACCNVPTGHEVRVPSVVIGGTSNGSGG